MIVPSKLKEILLTLLLIIAAAVGYAGDYSSSSVLSSGKWFKIAVTEDGIYKIDYSRLKQLGLEYPSNPVIFGNNCGQLSYYNDGSAPDDLKEIAVSRITGSDGVLNEGDYILFYGQGTNRWVFDETAGSYKFIRHDYSDTAFYFLTSVNGQGKRIRSASVPGKQPDRFSNTSDVLYIHESETENIIHSGREWYQPASYSRDTEIRPSFNDIVISEKVRYFIRVLARAAGSTHFRLSENGSPVTSVQIEGTDLSSTTGTYARIAFTEGEILPLSSNPVYYLTFSNNGDISAKGWIDYIILQARKQNNFDGEITFYRDAGSAGPGIVTEFSIYTSIPEIVIWDITDPYNVMSIDYSRSGNTITFKAASDTLKTYIAFKNGNVKSADLRQVRVPNQDIHASGPAEMIIVTHPYFMSYAYRFAEMHMKKDGLLSLVVTPEQIYNEFSGGIPDIAAIRNFLRMKFLLQKNTDHPLKYLLLLGDGSYNNKIPPPGNTSYIPSYQTRNSNVMVTSFTSDDFYGLLDDGEGETMGNVDIGIGRLPVSDTIEAGIMVSKIENYLNKSNNGNWKNIVCLTADDEDGNIHVTDAERLADLIRENAPWANVSKIYFDAYDQITTPTGQFYPEVSRAIDDRINAGALIFNYIGHANETSLGHERVLTPDNLNKWNNASRLPLFITATCEFSRFDDIKINTITGDISGKYSTGEKILLYHKGGAIALMSTTRLAYSASNFSFNRNILSAAFKRDTEGNAPRLGDIIKSAKNMMAGTASTRNFILLGDPAIRLSWPWYGNVVTDSLISVNGDEISDTLKALSAVSVAGHIEDHQGSYLENFNGIVAPLVLGKVSEVQTLANDGGPTMTFETQDNILFSGRTKAENGKFSFTFLIPRDIDYSFGKGKISYYAFDEEREMNGLFSDFIIGGFSNSNEIDTTGPFISLYFNDTLFRSGGITGPNPALLALLEDKGGINTSGASIGHDITCWLDDDRSISYVLNNYYENDFGSYDKGRIIYNFSQLEEGSHKLTLKAWDNFNNSGEKSIIFTVATEQQLSLTNLINYPNPFSSYTKITAGHNKPEEVLNVTVTIFDMNGSVLKIITTSIPSTGYQIAPIVWDRTLTGGSKAGRGIYPYRMEVVTGKGERCSISGKMIIY